MMQLETTNKTETLTLFKVYFRKSEYINLQPLKIVNFLRKIKTSFYRLLQFRYQLSIVVIAYNLRSFHMILNTRSCCVLTI